MSDTASVNQVPARGSSAINWARRRAQLIAELLRAGAGLTEAVSLICTSP